MAPEAASLEGMAEAESEQEERVAALNLPEERAAALNLLEAMLEETAEMEQTPSETKMSAE